MGARIKPREHSPSETERLRRGARRPIRTEEAPHLERLGDRLRELRRKAGFRQAELARRAELSPWMLRALERGARRTHRSTLERVAQALASAPQPPAPASDLADDLMALAGQALAPESPYRARVERRRARRRQQGRYLPRRERILAPAPGETFPSYLRRLRAVGANAPPGITCPTFGAHFRV